MRRRWYFFLFMVGLGAVSMVALFQDAPGYMDADYYYVGGLRLATGAGFSEPILWNYLDDPAGLPHPSHTYWMPLASLMAAAGMKLSGMVDFNGARLFFLLVAALIPPLTAAISYSLTFRNDFAILAGLFAAFPAFYLSYLGTTDNFAVYMLLGGLWFLAVDFQRMKVVGQKSMVLQDDGPKASSINFQPYLLGLLAGLMHLARADGILWLFISFAAAITETGDCRSRRGKIFGSSPISNPRSQIPRLIPVLLGYLLIMGPWMARNLAIFGTPLSPAGGGAMWLAGYDELYAFPAAVLTPAHWWASGLGEILRVRVYALGQNLLSAFVVQGNIFLAPLILLGFWRFRSDRRIKFAIFAWAATLFSMTIIFPHQGWRGGFFHSGASLQPLLWAAAPVGLEMLVGWGVRVRNWHGRQATAVFRAGLVGLAVLLAVLVVRERVMGVQAGARGKEITAAWGQSDFAYRRIDLALKEMEAGPGDIVVVNNPAGYYAAAARAAIVIPDGTEENLLAAAHRYGARFVLLEANHPVGLNELYIEPGDRPGLRFLDTVENIQVYLVE